MSRLSLIKPSVCPPEGFRYVFPEDGYLVNDHTYDAWVQHARNHLQANQREEPPDLAAQMEDQLCQTLEPGWCAYDDDSRPRPSTSLDWGAIAGGVETFARWIRDGCRYVSQAEADRRALICTRCYLNVNVSGCAGCQKVVKEIVRNKMTQYDSALRACAVCKCLLAAKVHFPLEILDKENARAQSMYPEFCWLKAKKQEKE